MSGVDEVSPMPVHSLSVNPANMDRRRSGDSTLAGLLHSATSSPNPGAANAGALAQPMMVRRASKPSVSLGVNQQLQAFLQRYTVADLQAWSAKRPSASSSSSGSPTPGSQSPSTSSLTSPASSAASPSAPAASSSSPLSNPNPAHTLPPRGVIELPSTATPAEGFELLLKNNILSAPVYDAAAKHYTGFLDVRDLVSSIVFAHEEQQLTTAFSDQWNELMLKGMQRFGTAVSVTYLSRRNPFKPMMMSATLLQVARALSTQLHRVPIVDEQTGKCISILSQSLLIQFLAAHRDELKDELRQTIGSLQLGLCKVVSVASDASAWAAFKVLEINAVSGIAIVDRDGKLVGNTSARDLKYFVMNRGGLSLDSPIQVHAAGTKGTTQRMQVHGC